MKKAILIILFLSSVYSLGAEEKKRPRPKWAKPDLWTNRLQKGLLEKQIVKLFGKPIYKHITSRSLSYYYQSLPKCETDDEGKKIVTPPSYGYIILFSEKSRSVRRGRDRQSGRRGQEQYLRAPAASGKPVYIVATWEEPDWNLVNNGTFLQLAPKKKSSRKTMRWERQQNWAKLVANIPDKKVKQILGNPKNSLRTEDTRILWYYGDIEDYGIVAFSRKGSPSGKATLRVTGWSEPFWPEVEKGFYAKPQNKPLE